MVNLRILEWRLDAYDRAFGAVIAKYRKRAGLKQEDLGEAVHRTYVSDLERGLKSPSLRTVVKLAAILETSPTELIKATEQQLAKYERSNS